MTKLVTLERPEPGLALVQMQDAEGKNAFSPPFVEALLGCLEQAAGDPEVRVCLLRGLPEVFCAGASEELLLDLAKGSVEATDILLSRALLDLPLPAVAAIEGHAVGGGLTLGLCCDVVLLARESRYGCPFMNLGFTPGMGTTRLLQAAVGEYVANEMMYGGQYLKGAHFAGSGGVNYVLPRAEVYPRALSVARRMADKPRRSLELLKRHLSRPRRQAFEEARTVEAFMHRICFDDPETAKRIQDDYARIRSSTDKDSDAK
jgi:polyketide biosynthesis enoyl-CoA hydratase PksI